MPVAMYFQADRHGRCTTIRTVAKFDASDPSNALKVNVTSPAKLLSGVYKNEPLLCMVRVPCSGPSNQNHLEWIVVDVCATS